MMTSSQLEFGVTLPVFDSLGAGIPRVTESARRAEDLEFDSIWAGDHIFFHRPNLECLIALACAAGATSHLRLGTGVLLPALREPVVLAKQLLTLQIASGDRLVLGIGVGGEHVPEWNAIGINRGQRAQRTDDFLEFLETLNDGQAFDFRGRYLQLAGPAMLPQPAERPAIWIGGRSDAALRRTAKFAEGWLSVWTSPRRIVEAGDRLSILADEQGRPVPRLGAVVFVNIGERRKALSEGAAFVQAHYGIPFERMEKWFLAGPASEVAHALAEYRDVGVSLFVLYPGAPDPSAQFDAVRDVVELVKAG